jgi:hypothetical protein
MIFWPNYRYIIQIEIIRLNNEILKLIKNPTLIPSCKEIFLLLKHLGFTINKLSTSFGGKNWM